MNTPPNQDGKPVSVVLPARYWITVLALVDAGVREISLPQFEKLKKEGRKPDDLSLEMRAALTGPVFARAAIVKALHEAGVMTPEANFQHGTDALMALIKRFQNEQRD